MAYIARHYLASVEWYGPCPNKAGEFCGNSLKKDKVIEQYLIDNLEQSFHLHLATKTEENFYIDKPSACGGRTSDEMAALGYVGKYLKADAVNSEALQSFRLGRWTEVDTDALCEEVVSGERLPLRLFQLGVPMQADSQ